MFGIIYFYSGFCGLWWVKEFVEGFVELVYENDCCVYIGVYGLVECVCV